MIINEDTIFADVISEDIQIISDAHVTVSGIVSGNISVEDTSSLTMTGICNKSIEIFETARSSITGIVNGTVINRGGNVRISGIVSSISGKPHSVLVKKDSIVGGNRLPADQMAPY